MNRARMLGGVLGVVTLVSIFILPFSNIAEGPGGSTDTLAGIFRLFVTTFYYIQTVGPLQLTELAYVYISASIIVLLSGVTGVYPKVASILGIVGMAEVTFSPFVVFNQYSFSLSTYGIGYWTIWGASIGCAVAAILVRRQEPRLPSGESPASPMPKESAPPEN